MALVLQWASHQAPALSSGLDAPLIPLLQPLGLVAAGVFVGRMGRIPAGALFLPMVVGAVLNSLGVMHIPLPP